MTLNPDPKDLSSPQTSPESVRPRLVSQLAEPGVVYTTGLDRLETPVGHRLVSVRTNGAITGWRLSTDEEEKRFAVAERYARVQSTYDEIPLTSESDIEDAYGRERRFIWETE